MNGRPRRVLALRVKLTIVSTRSEATTEKPYDQFRPKDQFHLVPSYQGRNKTDGVLSLEVGRNDPLKSIIVESRIRLPP